MVVGASVGFAAVLLCVHAGLAEATKHASNQTTQQLNICNGATGDHGRTWLPIPSSNQPARSTIDGPPG